MDKIFAKYISNVSKHINLPYNLTIQQRTQQHMSKNLKRHFTKKGGKQVNENILNTIRNERDTSIIMRYNCMSTRMAKSQKTDHTKHWILDVFVKVFCMKLIFKSVGLDTGLPNVGGLPIS